MKRKTNILGRLRIPSQIKTQTFYTFSAFFLYIKKLFYNIDKCNYLRQIKIIIIATNDIQRALKKLFFNLCNLYFIKCYSFFHCTNFPTHRFTIGILTIQNYSLSKMSVWQLTVKIVKSNIDFTFCRLFKQYFNKA